MYRHQIIGVYMIYVHIFSREKDTLWAWSFILVVIFNTFDNEPEGTIIMYLFIKYIWYDLKDIDVNN